VNAVPETIRSFLRRALTAIDPYWAVVRAWYQKREPRERMLVNAGIGILGVFLAYNLIYVSIQDWQESLKTEIESRQVELSEARRLTETYMERKAELKAAEKTTIPRSKDFSLFSVGEGTLTQTVGREKIGSITPAADRKLPDGFTQFTVDLKLQNVSLAQVVDALYGLKSLSSPVAVQRLDVTRRPQDSHAYDVEMTCVALAKNG